MYKIQKEFDFAYSHRVHNQELRPELALDCNLGCTAQHGHNGKISVSLEAEELDHKGMVLDFKELGFFRKFVDDNLDHRCILDISDPSIPTFYPLLKDLELGDNETLDQLLKFHSEGYFTIWPGQYRDLQKFEIEIYRGLVLVNFVPTSENLSKWLFDIVQAKLEGYAKVSHVEFYETPKSKSVYYG